MSTTVVQTPSSQCEFGIGVADITPPVGMYHRMWGAAAHDRSTGIHRPLRATVAVMRPLANATVDWQPLGETSRRQTVLVSLDHCLLRAPEMESLIHDLCQQTGLKRGELLITFSHTHSAGYLSRDRAELPGGDLIGPYLDELPSRIATAFRAAEANCQPAMLTYGATTCEMGCQRDYFDDARGHFVCGFNPDAAQPLPLNVVRVTSTSSVKTLATIVNYPCHSTTLAWENTLVSPDYIGALREVVERETSATCLFLLAPCGDIGPRDGYVGDVSVADRNGRQVGFAALSVLTGMPRPGVDQTYSGPVFSGATLGAWHWREWDDSRRAATADAKHIGFKTLLPYLPTLPKLADAEQRYHELIADEAAARTAGDHESAARLRTLVERQFRLLHRIAPLPSGDQYPMPAWAWQWGDASWIATEGEPYHFLQAELTRRFPKRPLIAITLANGTNCSYVPTREAFDRKGLYQTEVALLAPGSLEQLTDSLANRLLPWDVVTN